MHKLISAIRRFLVPLFCLFFFFFLIEIRRSTWANNDAFLQILAAEGLLQKRGYGFTIGDTFISIGHRSPHTRWPPGLTLLAASLESFSVRPLEAFSATLPWAGTLNLLLLMTLFVKRLNLAPVEATVLAVAALGCGAYWQWHGEVGTEPYFLVLLILLLILSTRREGVVKPIVVSVTWLLTMLRTAGGYVAIGLALLWGLDQGKRPYGFVTRSIVAASVLMTPLIAFMAYFGLSQPHVGNPHANIIEQITGQIFWLHEVISPHTDFAKRFRPLGTALGGVILAFSGWMAWRVHRHRGHILNVITAAFVLGTGYMVMLTISASRVGYDWAGVYRVSAMSLILISIAFWGGAFEMAPSQRIRRFVLLTALAVGLFKVGYVIFRQDTPVHSKDYRSTILSFRAYVSSLDGATVAMCADDSYERGVSYAILYGIKHGEAISRPVRFNAFERQYPGADCHGVERNTGAWVRRGGL